MASDAEILHDGLFRRMKPLLKTLTLLLLAGAALSVHEHMAQTWLPMFQLILASLLIATITSYLIFNLAEKLPPGKKKVAFNCLSVFAFVVVWNVLWAFCEEGLIQYNRVTGGYDDTGGRYFYPGHSGTGYADGFDAPLKILWRSLTFGIPGAIILGLPMGLGYRSELFRWK